MGDDEQAGPVEPLWPAAAAVVAAPPRAPLVLECDDALVRSTARAVLRALLIGWRGLALALLSVGLAYLVATGGSGPAGWPVALGALGLYLLQVTMVALGASRAMRRMLPAGGRVVSWYAAPGVLAIQTGSGRTDLRAGSLRQARRRGAVTSVWLRRSRRRGSLPSALLTDEDLAFLVGSDNAAVDGPGGGRPSAAPSAGAPGPAEDMPLLLVVTSQTRRDLRRAAVAWTVRRPQMVLLLGSAAGLVAIATLSGQPANGPLAVVLVCLWSVRVVRTARAVGRAYEPGALVRAGLTADGLRLQTGDDLVDTYPLHTARRCHVGRRHVRIDLGRGRPSLFVARDLFPPTELAALQRRVAAH
ncbi:hypothetical protein ACFUC1_14665 [Pedococcus sp. NPDC057267]|uniref:hypothetical protein n=1 Tax=Pedococcus sp. NPDC057267 TaxID=3346077 RepID=UPI00363A8687